MIRDGIVFEVLMNSFYIFSYIWLLSCYNYLSICCLTNSNGDFISQLKSEGNKGLLYGQKQSHFPSYSSRQFILYGRGIYSDHMVKRFRSLVKS